MKGAMAGMMDGWMNEWMETSILDKCAYILRGVARTGRGGGGSKSYKCKCWGHAPWNFHVIMLLPGQPPPPNTPLTLVKNFDPVCPVLTAYILSYII